MKTVTLSCLLFVPVLTSCSASLTLEGSGVRVAPEATAECQPISAVEATGSSEEETEVLLRNKAGEMNANLVVIQDKAEAGGDHRFKGEAYNCKQQ